tara:strand:+ start:1287 stop:1520 length:234 start_codon:yes stop_codon:yes gene_type:complete
MITDLILMDGQGLFVWLAFGITLIACLIFYFKTRKTLKKYEKDFSAELERLSEDRKQSVLKKSKIASQVFASQNKTF